MFKNGSVWVKFKTMLCLNKFLIHQKFRIEQAPKMVQNNLSSLLSIQFI